MYVYAGNVLRVCVCLCAAFFALPPSATIYRCTYTRANKRILACVRMFVLPLMPKYSRRHAPLMVKTCKRHTHIPTYIWIHVHTVCEFDGATLDDVWGQNFNLTASSSAFAALGNKFRQSACCMRIAFNRFRSAPLISAQSALWLRVKVSEHSHQLLLLRMCASDVWRVETPSCRCCTVLQARCACVCVCVCWLWSKYTGRASGNMVSEGRLKSRFQHKLETLFLRSRYASANIDTCLWVYVLNHVVVAILLQLALSIYIYSV